MDCSWALIALSSGLGFAAGAAAIIGMALAANWLLRRG